MHHTHTIQQGSFAVRKNAARAAMIASVAGSFRGSGGALAAAAAGSANLMFGSSVMSRW